MVELEGPTGLILTTTHVKLYPDDETRMFSVDVADTRNQTRKVLNAIGAQVADSNLGRARVLPGKWDRSYAVDRDGPHSCRYPSLDPA